MKTPEKYRWKDAPAGYATEEGDPFGVFRIPGREASGRCLKVIATDGVPTGWEHVSVSLDGHPNRCPSWEEMCIVKGLFWPDDECVVQFHPPASEYVNIHPGCLHLWRFPGFPMPPKICV